MELLRKIFGGASANPAGSKIDGAKAAGDPAGMYFFIQPDKCAEVVRLRVNRENDLSLDDEEHGYWVHKVVRGTSCFTPVEVDLYFDLQKRLRDSQLKGGRLVDEAAYIAWQKEQHGA
jgi:hypothetical protein